MSDPGRLSLSWVFVWSCIAVLGFGAAQQHPTLAADEEDALKRIGATLKWDFNLDLCSGRSNRPTESETAVAIITCDCSFANNTCHVVSIVLRGQDLQGTLPPELQLLPYLQEIDLSRNFLNGTIPRTWATLPLVNISLLGNRISGPIPKELGNITTLRNLTLEANQLSGELPPELGRIVDLERLQLSSNQFTGEIPPSFSGFRSLEDLRLSDNNFTGQFPDFIGNLTKLTKIVLYSSGLKGPIPSSISSLENMNDMRISDLEGPASAFPPLSRMKNMKYLILRNCNLTGPIPPYFGELTKLKELDISYNKLSGQIPSTFVNLQKSDYIYLTANFLNGPVRDWMLTKGDSIDLSYNSFTIQGSTPNECQRNKVNLFGSTSMLNNVTKVAPCLHGFACPKRERFLLYINCGGPSVTINGTTYTGDEDDGGASRSVANPRDFWAFSNTGDFLDNNQSNDGYRKDGTLIHSSQNSTLYTTARVSPLSLTYYGLCLMNGNYTVRLHFAEIVFAAGNTFQSLGRRIFDIYIQGKLAWKDFDIVKEAGGPGIPIWRNFSASVTTNTLEIRLYWAGKGTRSIPAGGDYGPLISAISVDPDFVPPDMDGNGFSTGAVAGIVISALFVTFMILGILWLKGCFGQKQSIDLGNKKFAIWSYTIIVNSSRSGRGSTSTAMTTSWPYFSSRK